MFQDFNINDLVEFFDIKLTKDELLKIDEKQKSIINKSTYKEQIQNKKSLDYYFKNIRTKEERNIAIKNAYNNSHSQVDISRYINLSESSISKVVNS